MTGIDQDVRDAFAAARERFLLTEKVKREAASAAKLLAPKLIGKRLLSHGKLYEISDVDYSYDGTIRARGYRVLANGKRGSRRWDIGFICARSFDDAAAAA